MGDSVRVTVTVKSTPSAHPTTPAPRTTATPVVHLPAPAPKPQAHHPGSSLAFTGAPIVALVTVAMVLVLLGFALSQLAAPRRRRRRQGLA
jgi:hypothetical protein